MRSKLGWAAIAVVLGIVAVALVTSGGQPAAEAQALAFPLDAVHFESAASGLDQPVDIAFTGLVTDTRMFVVERPGRIRVVQANGSVLPTSFLDIVSKVSDNGEEEGLLGLVFSPNFGANGYFYVYYVDNHGDLQLSGFAVSSNPNVADTTEHKLLNIPHPDCQNHDGGDLNFGPDGYLYLAPGDGGGANDNCGDVPNNDNDAQRLNSLLGKVLRLNVFGLTGYTVPTSNPYANVGGARGEIWDIGLRNPWRFSFDRLTGDMYIGDVGQDQYEEVDFQPANSAGGVNFGWRCYEGFEPYLNCGGGGPFQPPVFAYDHSLGQAISAGFVYRGSAYPSLYGYFFFSDYISGRFWARGSCNTVTELGQLIGNSGNPSSWGQDALGELYVADLGGTIYRLVGDPGPTAPPVLTPMFLPVVSNRVC